MQVCAYELRVAAIGHIATQNLHDEEDPLATNDATERLFNHWISVMTDVEYFFPDNPRLLPQRVRRLLSKAKLTVTETQILRGFLTAVEKTRAKRTKG